MSKNVNENVELTIEQKIAELSGEKPYKVEEFDAESRFAPKETPTEKLNVTVETTEYVDLPPVIEGLNGGLEINRSIINPDKMNPLLQGLMEQQEEAEKLRKSLEEKTAHIGGLEALAAYGEDPVNNGIVEYNPSDNDITSIIDSMTEDAIQDGLGIKNTEDIEDIINKMEETKVYADDQIRLDEYSGPADYTVIESDEFTDTVADALNIDALKVRNKSGRERAMLIEKLTNSGVEITTTLVNSGIWLNFTGAGTNEIIAMNSIQNDDPVTTALGKFLHVFKHVTNSSIGKLSLKHAIKIISYYDIDTLFYGLYVATHPTESEIMRTCDKCNKEFYARLLSRNLLLNGEEFTKSSDYIKHNTTLDDVLRNSSLNKEYVKQHDFGLIIHYKNPSISSFLNTVRSVSQDNIQKYPDIVELIYNISKVLIPIPNTDNEVVAYTEPNDIIEIISSLKRPEYKYDIIDVIEEIRPSAVPEYGFEEVKCPHCGHKNQQHALNIQTLLFLLARQEEERAMLNWTAKQQKKKKKK